MAWGWALTLASLDISFCVLSSCFSQHVLNLDAVVKVVLDMGEDWIFRKSSRYCGIRQTLIHAIAARR